MAVLVANISFVGYVTPPGGNHPYWETCSYPIYVGFLFCNGMAFLGSIGAVGIVVVVPRLYPSKTAEKTASVNFWIRCGLFTLVFSFLSFTVAFVLAGLVTGGFKAPSPTCGVLPCKDGGVACKPSVSDGSMAPLLSMNKMKGECFYVSQVASGRFLTKTYPAPFVWYRNNSINGTIQNGKGKVLDPNGCFLVVEQLQSTDAIKRYTSNTNKVLCTAGPLPNNPDLEAASKVSLEDALLNLTQNLWRVPGPWQGTPSYFLQITHAPGSPCSASVPGCLCSDHMAVRPDDLTFVTYANPRQSFSPQVYLAKIAGQQDDSHVNMSYNGDLDSNHIRKVFGHHMTLYSPAIFQRRNIAVYDEFQFRCSNAFKADQPTLCLYGSMARDSAMKWYKPVGESKGEFHRMCGEQNVSEPNGHACEGLAVDKEGKYILISKLAEFGSEVVWNEDLLDQLGRSTEFIIFLIVAIAIVVYLTIAVFVALAYNGVPLCHSESIPATQPVESVPANQPVESAPATQPVECIVAQYV